MSETFAEVQDKVNNFNPNGKPFCEVCDCPVYEFTPGKGIILDPRKETAIVYNLKGNLEPECYNWKPPGE